MEFTGADAPVDPLAGLIDSVTHAVADVQQRATPAREGGTFSSIADRMFSEKSGSSPEVEQLKLIEAHLKRIERNGIPVQQSYT